MRVTLAYNVKPGLRLAQQLHSRGVLQQYFGVGMLTRPISTPLIRNSATVQRFNAARVETSLTNLPYTPIWEAELAFHAVGGRVSLGNRLRASQSLFDLHVRARLEPCDIFHATSGTLLHSGQKAARRGARVICHRRALHHVYEAMMTDEKGSYRHPEAQLGERLEREYSIADIILCNSALTAGSFNERGFDRSKLVVIHNAIDTSFFTPSEAPRSRAGAPSILYVGTIDRRKGLDVLRRAWPFKPTEAHLTLAGRIDDKAMAASLAGLGANIIGSVGPQKLLELYRDADVVVLPSRADAFGYVAIEALACGTPVIVSDACGSAEVVSRFDAGWVFPTQDPSALRDALLKSTDPVQRQKHSEQAIAHRAYFDWQRYGDEIMGLYTNLVDTPGRDEKSTK